MLSEQVANKNDIDHPQVVEERTEGEVLQTWLARTGECVVRTHMRVDADAAFSAALILEVKPEAQLELTPAAETTDDPSLLAVDMLNGRQAIKGLEQGSAFGLLHKELGTKNKAIHKLFWGWAKQLNLTDSGKRCNDGVVLAQLVNSWRQVGLSDEEIVFRARELITRDRCRVHDPAYPSYHPNPI